MFLFDLEWSANGMTLIATLGMLAVMASAAEPAGNIITDETGVSLGLILAAIGTFIGTFGCSAWWVVVKINKLSNSVAQLSESVARLSTTTITKAEAAENALRTAMLNPGHRVPDPRDPTKVFVVESSHTENSRGDED